jgi:hypothetical protein
MLGREGLREWLGLKADASDAQVIARLADEPDLRADLQGRPRPLHPQETVAGDVALTPSDYVPRR